MQNLDFSVPEIKLVGNYLYSLYTTNKELFDRFYLNLINKNYSECIKDIDLMPDEVKDVIRKRADSLNVLFNKLEDLLSIFTDAAKTAFAHAKDLAEKDPTKAQYIFSLALVGMLISYILGKRSR